jgi:hypothetical protein
MALTWLTSSSLTTPAGTLYTVALPLVGLRVSPGTSEGDAFSQVTATSSAPGSTTVAAIMMPGRPGSLTAESTSTDSEVPEMSMPVTVKLYVSR